MSEVLEEKKRNVQTSVLRSSSKEDSMLTSQDKSSESCAERQTSAAADLELRDKRYQPVLSPLPHPNRLLHGSALETDTPKNVSNNTTADITQAISTRLTDYKMHGMVTSDMVQRPMAYRLETDPRRQSVPWTNTNLSHTHDIRSTGVERRNDHIGSAFHLSPEVVTHNRHGLEQDGIHVGHKRAEFQTTDSSLTSELWMFPSTGDLAEDSEGSQFFKWNEGNPPFKDQKHDQIRMIQDDIQQTSLFTGGVHSVQYSCHRPDNDTQHINIQSTLQHTQISPIQNEFLKTGEQERNKDAEHFHEKYYKNSKNQNYAQNMENKLELERSNEKKTQTVPSFCIVENKRKAVNNQSVFITNNKSQVREDTESSPQLFSQHLQSQVPALPSKLRKRCRKLRPVVTAPDELTDKVGNSHINVDDDSKDRDIVRDRFDSSEDQTLNRLSDHQTDKMGEKKLTISRINSNPSLYVDCKHTAEAQEKCAEAKLVYSPAENMDFSGFTDSFTESEHGEDHCLDESKMASACQDLLPANRGDPDHSTKQEFSKTDLKSNPGCLFDKSNITYPEPHGHSLKPSCSGDMFAHSAASSPDFVIANGGLDCSMELEEDSTAAAMHKEDSYVQSNREIHSGQVQRLKKVHNFVSQIKALHPNVYSQIKGNHPSLVNKIVDIETSTDRSCHSLDFKHVQKPLGNMNKPDSLSPSAAKPLGNMNKPDSLSPSAATFSPPIDISPDTCSDSNVLFNAHMDNTFDEDKSTTRNSHFDPSGSKNHLEHTRPSSQSDSKRMAPKQDIWMRANNSSPVFVTCSVPSTVVKEPTERNFTAPRKVGLGKFKKPGVAGVSGCLPTTQFQSGLCHELQFCSREDVDSQATPLRQVTIPPSFDSILSYKQILTAALTEFMNIQLFSVAKLYHCALSKVDISTYVAGVGAMSKQAGASNNPACKCGSVSKVAQVKKEGPNKGRFFYACSAPRDKQCKFFQWVDQQIGNKRASNGSSIIRPKFSDPDSIMGYFRGQGVTLFCHCLFLRRSDDYSLRHGFPKWARPQQFDSVPKKSLFIKLPPKKSGTSHAKDDIWIISKSLSFTKGETFVARSTFHGPNSNREVAVDPVTGYSASSWTEGSVCHAIHCGNAATELTCLANIQDHVDMTSLPVLPHLLSCQPGSVLTSRTSSKGFKAPTVKQDAGKLHLPAHFLHDLTEEFISKYQLNADQAQALRYAASMMNKDADPTSSVLLIHGVFGAGKSFLLSVLILFLVELFQRNDTYSPGVPFPWKLLLSSTTNVAVDRVLLGLLELGFDDFVRVGSVKKIAKQVLPYSMHASGSDNQELKDLQEMLKSQDITPSEKQCVRKSIEKHRLGENRKRLGAVRVVGVTCAACSFQCLDKMLFPFVVLDECSQMTEPASLLPIGRSACEKVVLVGDPKQLDPTLQGSDAAHGEGLEQTLFDRLMKTGYEPVMLRTQYRCHPRISAVSNLLFYHNQLLNGVTAEDRKPILDLFPTMCFYDVSNGQDMTDSSGSFVNEVEAQFVTLLLSVLLAQGLQPASVGVITLYKAQARRIMDIIKKSKGDTELAGVQVSTVDAFQGGERDIIILSCVRTHSVGFIDSDKRMNVALTRARHHLLIVGRLRNLQGNKRWAQVIKHCQAVAGGVVSATAANKQLQAVLDQASEKQEGNTAHADGDTSVQKPTHCSTRTQASHRGSDLTTLNTSSSETYIVMATHQGQTADKHASYEHSDREGESDFAGSPEWEEFSPEKTSRVSKARRSRIKPLVIDEEKNDSSTDDDFLPDGLV